ncbi:MULTISPECIES: (2Fe-2S)-binding protein [Acetobacter]|uniref:NAD(FAD)-dependent dehydrogenase n=3 Tax=Acetobacter TaxID=434 RepID=A0A511XNQ0_9PROT|nr:MULTISPECIES: (2Fe-2S)-binding protein [Acetobacter]MBB3884418.1 putative molibdopterin-dependent oxidoreductase YjgC [Acetobacter oeni]NHN87104.1 (2Fe-2S)-binding protein [Acetobacter conturbans]NHO20360.1 (2Fe-2S)-binding protein [Acetobacter oeni]NHO32627.1 (2Fe-2S)-binding protein [Acetobacter fallax]NHO36175.1 (2Fe-2S)-binding protein [Acetobacter fallax]
MTGLFRRVAETGRPEIAITVDGHAVTALEGDTILTALLVAGDRLRFNEFDKMPRAGFCLMGACQDCRVWTEDGHELRACSTSVTPGLRIVTKEVPWTRP